VKRKAANQARNISTSLSEVAYSALRGKAEAAFLLGSTFAAEKVKVVDVYSIGNDKAIPTYLYISLSCLPTSPCVILCFLAVEARQRIKR
jgi:hypothetical protein